MKESNEIQLSDEQRIFMLNALSGKNILVDACIGSGKTTAIQHLCSAFPVTKKVLYLTYNKLLKLDARQKIKNGKVTVTNYHGFAYWVLKRIDVPTSANESVQNFNKLKPKIDSYDVLIIDEYQDIKLEFSELLEYIKANNPGIQIIAVGDMAQKVYDNTTLDVPRFMEQFLGQHIELSFTKCFRLPSDLAKKLGRIWKKEIIGVNDSCKVEVMTVPEVTDFLSTQAPKDILCLGSLKGDMTEVLNALESNHSDTFNKKTVYASIRKDESTGKVEPKKTSAIFTTFDSSKGLERKISVVFDFTESYWDVRVKKPLQKYDILRNIFCVAASRGKEHIIFVNNGEAILSEKTLSTDPNLATKYDNVNISELFDHKYPEDIDACYSLLECTEIDADDNSCILIKPTDELIDLSPCIGIYQEAVFFDQDRYSIDKVIELYFLIHKKESKDKHAAELALDEKILYLTSLDTKQERYRKQVATPFVSDNERAELVSRLSERFTPDENVQVSCEIPFYDGNSNCPCFKALGLCDVLKDEIVYELKFVKELSPVHFLQCACYMVALEKEKGVLWNTHNNSCYEIRIPDRGAFLDAVAKAATKRELDRYYPPNTTKNNQQLKIGVDINEGERK